MGEKGITLSGGQKARMALARALYADSDIFIFDDPISVVDATAAPEIYTKCLLGLKSTKTVILVTHQIGFLYDCDEVIILDDGSIKAQGTPRQVQRELDELSSMFKKGEESEQEDQPDETQTE